MAKTTFAEFSTTPADNTDINSIGIQGTNAVQNFDNYAREIMAILRRDVPGLALANTFTKTQTWTKGTDVASATSLTLGDGNYFDITGTTAITSIATKGVGTVVVLQFDGILTLTHHATDLILPGGANITTAAGDHAAFVEYASGDWRCFSYQRASGASVSIVPENWVDVASATTTDIGAAASQNVRITGTTTITGLGTVAAGTFRRVRFAGILTLTHNGTSLILPGAANITTAAGDVAEFISEGSGNWRCVNYQQATPRLPSPSFTSSEQSLTVDTNIDIAHGLGALPTQWSVVLRCKTADLGYAVGTEIPIASHVTHSGQSDQGVVVGVDATNVYIVQGSNFFLLSRTSKDNALLTTGSWRYVARAWI